MTDDSIRTGLRTAWRGEALIRAAQLLRQAKRGDTTERFIDQVAEAADGEALERALRDHRAESDRLLFDTQNGPDEAHRLRRQLAEVTSSEAYQLGLALTKALRTPAAFVRLPVTLGRLARQALAERFHRRASEALVAETIAPVEAVEPIESTPAPPDIVALPPPPPGPATIGALRIAVICDRFTADNLAPECEVAFLRPDDWREQISELRPHVLFVESAWTGLASEWVGKVSSPSVLLESIVRSCRAAGIRTVFWNKEDPLHFEAFIAVARWFDLVCTTDASSIPRYKRELGHDNVQLMMFALQPRMHNPIDAGARIEGSFFAGAWYGNQPARCKDFMALADALALVGPFDIYDRNAASSDPVRRYPTRYSRFNRGEVPYPETPALYRRYRLGLSLNTIKHSPTMFARRALELIGSGVSVYSNHSLALNQVFGDLVISTDNGERVLMDAYDELSRPVDFRYRLRRLAAMRAVLREHTWSERLKAMVRQLHGWEFDDRLPEFNVVARARTQEDVDRLNRSVLRQVNVHARLWVRCDGPFVLPSGVRELTPESLSQRPSALFAGGWIAAMHADDLYESSYLEDLWNARLFMGSSVIGKASFFRSEEGRVCEVAAELEYSRVGELALRRCIFLASEWTDSTDWLVDSVETGRLTGDDLLSVDALSYIERGWDVDAPWTDALPLSTGLTMQEMRRFAEVLPAEPSTESARWAGCLLDGRALAEMLNAGVVPAGTSAAPRRTRLELVSKLPADTTDAMFTRPLRRDELERDGRIDVCLDAPVAGAVTFFLDAMSAGGDILSRTHLPSNINVAADPRADTHHYRLAVSVTGTFVTHVDALWLRRREAIPQFLPGRGRLLIVVNGYPEAGHLYRNAFVHRRVLGYRALGVPVDVVWVSVTEKSRTFEHEGIPVRICDPESLRASLVHADYAAIAVHFLDETLWSALADAEIQPSHRRWFNYVTDEERAAAAVESEKRCNFWRGLLGSPPAGLRLVFVSATFAGQVWDDLGFTLPEEYWRTIPNPIDTDLFDGGPKEPEQRFRVLSIRPHASAIYANDQVAAVIHRLSSNPLFGKIQFRLIGDGPLFDRNFKGLERFANVTLERRFLSQPEIARLHREYGIFLIPSRGDTQGVSRDEAMSSGLVPITSDVGAIREFVGDQSGVIVAPEDVDALADAIIALVNDPSRFVEMSARAREQVLGLSSASMVVRRELEWLEMGGRTV